MEADEPTELYQPNLFLSPNLHYPHHNITRPTLHTIHDSTTTWPWGDKYQKHLITFQFLANFTSTTGLVNSFDCCSVEERLELLKSYDKPNSQIHGVVREASPPAKPRRTNQPPPTNPLAFQRNHIWGYVLDQPTPPASEEPMLPMADIQVQYTQNWMMLKPPTKSPAENINKPGSSGRSTRAGGKIDSEQAAFELQLLTSTGLRIVSRIKEVVMVKPRNSIVNLNWASHVEDACLEFFSPTNISRFLNLFWAGWYPNWPVIHKPTFALPTTMDILIAAMVVIGACLSPDQSEVDHARVWFNAIEEIVFTDAAFYTNISGDEPKNRDPSGPRDRKMTQVLQAAYAVCLYQNWEGNDLAKKRIRRYRYSIVVALARDMDIASSKHPYLDFSDPEGFDWHSFISREERIRTLIYVFLLDSGFVMFNNLPPRMAAAEMKLNLACPEGCFQADSARDCFLRLRQWYSSANTTATMSLSAALETLCQKELDDRVCMRFSTVGILNMFTMASALHSLLFQQTQTSFGYEPQLTPIRNALSNWIRIWHMMSPTALALSGNSSSVYDLWKRTGFMRHAAEFHLLAKIIVKHVEMCQRDRTTAQSNSFMLTSAAQPFGFEKYDETSMQQVNDLIVSFNSFNI
ncbi:uncharacterized protein A1O5_07439 [Cladophialophora psammophila CBS 110553]|uniref:Xylanolytic transcriptional activator regulatory domain-containing protein n=1 Tax=Cladophialophora psammophila CBS 110553 TaxID=1182543 RepID=W9WNF8_9EURO|nr:uncharacterized protein A1O5_07439 [Cladophialophora psammophila CBS 110553]EXJ69403.1 hypothetical protein A1O5_07439 [Cladophialophora psammophila CBS 110553]